MVNLIVLLLFSVCFNLAFAAATACSFVENTSLISVSGSPLPAFSKLYFPVFRSYQHANTVPTAPLVSVSLNMQS